MDTLDHNETSFLLMLERNRVWYFLDFATKQKSKTITERKRKGLVLQAYCFFFIYKINKKIDIF